MKSSNAFLGKYVAAAMIVWTCLLVVQLFFELNDLKTTIVDMARVSAKASFDKDVNSRKWNALHGGVYAPVTEKTLPNPHLADIPERDIPAPSGRKLTLINPAYMTRQMHEIAEKESGIKGHITSLNPIRPQNAPDQWEAEALRKFETGITEVSSLENMDNIEYLRFMSPLKTEQPCLRCHEKQGYKIGDIRGGISVSVPMKSYLASYNSSRKNILISHALIWAAGLVVIGIGSSRLRKKTDQLIAAEEEWEHTFNSIDDPIMILDLDYRIVKANRVMADALGVTTSGAKGMFCYKAVHGFDQPHADCPHAKLMADGQYHSAEICEERIGGTFLVSVSPIYSKDRVLKGSVHSARNISDRVQTEEKIKQYSKDLEQLLAVSREITETTDLKSLYRTFVSTSRDILSLDFSTLLLVSDDKTGLTVKDTMGFSESMIGHFSLVKGQGLANLVAMERMPDTVEDFSEETRFQVPAIVIEKKISSAIAVPMMMKNELVGVLIGHTLDKRLFSEREIAVYQHIANQAAVAIVNAKNIDAIRENEQKLSNITDSLGEGLYVVDDDGCLTFMNPEAERILGWTESELRNRNVHDIIHNRRSDGSVMLFDDCPVHNVIKNGRKFVSRDEFFIKKDGTVFPVSIISTPLWEGEKALSSITAFRDISERKQLEEEREKLITELQNALADIKTLQGILPICSFCKKIRDDKGAWTQMESYISRHTDAQFSHGMCAECAEKMYPQYFKKKDAEDPGNDC